MRSYFNLNDTYLTVLTYLDTSARSSCAEIGRKIGHSRETVKNALAKLESAEVITGYMTFINTFKLGLTAYVVYVELKGEVATEKARIFSTLELRPEIYWISDTGGKFDLGIGIIAANAYQFYDHLREIQNLLKNKISKISVNTRLRTVQFPRTYLTRRAPSRASTPRKLLYLGYHKKIVELDSLDRSILNALSKDARITVEELVKKLKRRRATIQRRLAKLEENGVIQGYCAHVHAEAYGYQIYRLLIRLNNSDINAVNQLYSVARDNPNVTYFDHGIGEWQVEVTCEIKNQKELPSILREFKYSGTGAVEQIDILPVFNDNLKFAFTL